VGKNGAGSVFLRISAYIDRMMPFDDYLKDNSVKQMHGAAYHRAQRLGI